MASSFTFVGYNYDLDRGVCSFQYRLVHDGKTREFTERLSWNPEHATNRADITPILQSLLLMLGISYWKTYCPDEIHIEPFALTPKQAEFWNTVYTKGLGEFFYRNQIDFRGLVNFPFSPNAKSLPVQYTIEDRALVPLGGGKDSLVTAELLKKQSKPFTFVTIGAQPLHATVAERVGVPLILIARDIDPQLIELNKQAGVYNGHIPISAVWSFIELLTAVIGGYNSIVVSHEKSANYGNVEYHGQEINHQWSKSEEYESLFQSYVKEYITPSVMYTSLLRSYTELQIIEKFVQYPHYFDMFTSCNKNFKLTADTKKAFWCGQCPKCAFVFLLLSAYLPKDTVVKIYNKNLYEDMALLPVFRELLGLQGIKPFECVGTPEESKEAFAMMVKKSEYKDEPIVVKLQKEL